MYHVTISTAHFARKHKGQVTLCCFLTHLRWAPQGAHTVPVQCPAVPTRKTWNQAPPNLSQTCMMHAGTRPGEGAFFAAGYHGMRVNFSLEATVIVTTRADFDALTVEDCPGPNANKTKANNMCHFEIPPSTRKKAPGKSTRHCCMLSALTAIDFARLVQLHVISLDRHWVRGDLQRDSMGLGHGYDWIDETEDALTALDSWRTTVLADSDQEPLIHALCKNQQILNGFGKHTAHNLLHLVAVWPGIPSAVLCHDDSLYFRSKKELMSFNPLRFNYRSNRAYINRYVKVYRKWYVDVPKALHDHLVNQGLLNVDHIIGQPYTPQPNEFLAPHCRFAWLPVHVHKIKKFSLYSVIMEMGSTRIMTDHVFQTLAEDIRHAGFVTTLGSAQFHNTNQNMQVVGGPHPRGRRPKVCNGIGHPAASRLTIKQLQECDGRGKHFKKDYEACLNAATLNGRYDRNNGTLDETDKAADSGGLDSEDGDTPAPPAKKCKTVIPLQTSPKPNMHLTRSQGCSAIVSLFTLLLHPQASYNHGAHERQYGHLGPLCCSCRKATNNAHQSVRFIEEERLDPAHDHRMKILQHQDARSLFLSEVENTTRPSSGPWMERTNQQVSYSNLLFTHIPPKSNTQSSSFSSSAHLYTAAASSFPGASYATLKMTSYSADPATKPALDRHGCASGEVCFEERTDVRQMYHATSITKAVQAACPKCAIRPLMRPSAQLLSVTEISNLTTGVSPLPAVFLMVIPLSIRTSSDVLDSFAPYHWTLDVFAHVSPSAWL
ncbi:hypothetical protein B0H21DRAFT_709143 [Amylocystis lapponica]|nr:hypothetical protein B0H21DRAFT_709143 [Amylocystis lapponica]